MARGSKPGERRGGRKKGSPNKRTVERAHAVAQAAEKIEAILGPTGFQGDAHALLMLVYKSDESPLSMRVTCAIAALPYEKPRLASIKHTGADGGPIDTADLTAAMTPEQRKEYVERRVAEIFKAAADDVKEGR